VSLADHGHLPLLTDFLTKSWNPGLANFVKYIYFNLVRTRNESTLDLVSTQIGKLSTKREAAGKVRVFAMVDVWTQSALSPLHKMLFAFLRTLPNDGTFDQEASVRRCLVKSTQSGKSFGYDLSAATDRLPILLQREIIDKVIPGFGEIWAKLLVDRYYHINSKDFDVEDSLHYEVGQPMGALSSWAMLAVTHHYIAQLAAVRAANKAGALNGPYWIVSPVDLQTFNLPSKWYTGYEVLGDDIVFFEDDVAQEYLLLMDLLGVPINLSKSVIATNATFEFAKVTGHKGHHVAAVSWAMFMAQPSVMGRAGIAYSLIRKGIVHTNVIRWLMSFARQSRYTAGSPNTFFLALGTMFSRAGKMEYFDFLYSIMQKTAGMFNVYATLLEKSNITTITQAISAIVKTGEKIDVPNPLRKRRGWKADEWELKLSLKSTIHLFLAGDSSKNIFPLSPHKDAIILSREILTSPSMLLGTSNETQLQILDHKGVFSLNKKSLQYMTQHESFIHHLFCYLFVHFCDKLTVMHMEIEQAFDKGKPDHSVSELMDIVDRIDRYKEQTALVRRLRAKLANETIPSRNLVDSPLQVLEQLTADFDPSYYGAIGFSSYLPGGPDDLQQYMYASDRVEEIGTFGVKYIGDAPSRYLSLFGPTSSGLK